MKNEPAFPNTPEMMIACGGVGGQGMSLRDYFAAKSLPILIELFTLEKLTLKSNKKVTEKEIAQQAYCFADAMLIERDR